MTTRAEPPIEPGTYSQHLARKHEADGEHFCRCETPCNPGDHSNRRYRCQTCRKCGELP